MTAAELPEGLLSEQQRDAAGLRARIGQRRQNRNRPTRMRARSRRARGRDDLRRTAERVEGGHEVRRVAGGEERFRFDQAGVEASGNRNGRARTPETVHLDDEGAAILRLDRVLAVAGDLVVRRDTAVIRRQKWDR